MKKTIHILMVAILFFACQPKTSIKPFDLNAAKDEIANLPAALDTALGNKDANSIDLSFS
ncbi:MAG: hypothetical protein A2W99_00065 [Bacteroidetes bacterium GWF2_33_16]|nr:MAG: hypothetical protein A2X00_02770 [Bacteroidetes bacterium GWE2_32_14]OFY08671.1 MAG: hypothetical protein A2W99_00065 [Bacteroidetes bacterium GWF2_33_16]